MNAAPALRSKLWRVPFLALLMSTLACLGTGRAALKFSPDQLPPATLGQPYIVTISITQNATPVGQMSVQAADLPPGLSMAFFKGRDYAVIGGTPQQAGTYKFTVSAWCFGTNVAGQSGHQDYQIVVQ